MSTLVRDWYRSSFGQALTGGVLLWAALPPLGIWPLAWIAPLWWVLLIRREKLPLLQVPEGRVRLRPWMLLAAAVLYFLAGLAVNAWFHSMRYHLYWMAETVYWPGLLAIFLAAARIWASRPYRCLWLAGMFFWLAALHWLRLPHWSVGLGWLAAGIYFGCYLPVFVGLSRVGVHVLRLPVILVAPVVYAGMELAQAYLLSGMTMGCLEHTQYRWTLLIQISDLTGCYGVTFLMMFVAACLARMAPCGARGWTFWPLAPAAGLMAAVLVYGHFRTANVETDPGLKIALIQGDIDIQLDDPENGAKTVEATDKEYRGLTEVVADYDRSGKIDLIVWPETVFYCDIPVDGNINRWPWLSGESNAKVPDDFPEPQQFPAWLDYINRVSLDAMTATAAGFGRPMLVGIDREHYGARGREIYNSAALITPDGKWCEPGSLEQSYYDKMHLVPFGEYMPFAKSLPWLQSLSPLGSSSSPGGQPKGFMLKNVCLAPNICYETVLPQVIRNQLVALREQGVEPQILVNVTNDGWFWGSSELEQHLACGVYRAVECRRPMVIAANTGISAAIDGSGNILAEGPRQKTCLIVRDVRLDRRESWYLRHGDWFAGTCLAAAILLACAGTVAARRKKP
jgi:apolipoprotein N-acyltransferase